MNFPVVKNSHATSNLSACSFCLNTMPNDESDIWIMLGAMGGSEENQCILGKDAFAFFSICRHSGGHIDIVKNGLNGQADIGFCSADCLRDFFNRCVDQLEQSN